jgi:hypothetical protein
MLYFVIVCECCAYAWVCLVSYGAVFGFDEVFDDLGPEAYAFRFGVEEWCKGISGGRPSPSVSMRVL